VPARREGDRWVLGVEIDALAALEFGLTRRAIEAMYRAQFPVLHGYDRQTLFDANARQLSATHHNHGFLQARLEADAKQTRTPGWVKIWDRVQQYLAGDTTVDLSPFKPPFRPADRVAAITRAYWTFVDRYDLTPPDTAERPS
jgi:hypothetical protein